MLLFFAWLLFFSKRYFNNFIDKYNNDNNNSKYYNFSFFFEKKTRKPKEEWKRVYQGKYLFIAQSNVLQSVVKMGKISFEKALFLQDSFYSYINSIDCIYSKYYEYRSNFSSCNNSECCEHKTEKHGPTVSHKNFLFDIKVPKWKNNSY